MQNSELHMLHSLIVPFPLNPAFLIHISPFKEESVIYAGIMPPPRHCAGKDDHLYLGVKPYPFTHRH